MAESCAVIRDDEVMEYTTRLEFLMAMRQCPFCGRRIGDLLDVLQGEERCLCGAAVWAQCPWYTCWTLRWIRTGSFSISYSKEFTPDHAITYSYTYRQVLGFARKTARKSCRTTVPEREEER